MSKKFTDLTLKATAAAADIMPINDVSAATDKKTTVAGLAAAVAASLGDGAVQGNALATSAITLGYAQITSSFATASGSFVDVTGLTTTVTVPSGGRRVEFNIDAGAIKVSGAGSIWTVALVEDSTVIQSWLRNEDTDGYNVPVTLHFSKTPSAGSHTYKVQLATTAGTATITASTPSAPVGTGPASIHVKAS